MDQVLTAPPPRLTVTEALEVALSVFGVTAATARDLGSERDPDVRPRRR